MAMAHSAFSFAMMVRLLISYRLFACRSRSESLKSAATSAEAMEAAMVVEMKCRQSGFLLVVELKDDFLRNCTLLCRES